MNELIKIQEHNGRKAVSARELHSYLDSKKDFSTWIKHRIGKYGLTENMDYIRFTQKGEANNATFIEYALTLDAAKELSMVEGNAKGKEARKYFIDVEKQVTSHKPLSPAEQLLQSAQLMVDHERRLDKLETRLNGIAQLHESNMAELKALPVSTETLPEMGLRDRIRLMVNRYAQALVIPQQSVWDSIYQTLYYTYHVHIKGYSKLIKSESWLEVAERKEHLDKIFIIISNMMTTKGLSNQ